jgi:hypothetical protein
MSHESYFALQEHVQTLRLVLPQLLRDTLGAPPRGVWLQTLERNVLPALQFDIPVLLVAVCGGGSTGKSTLVNALAGRYLSRVAFRAGLTARALLVGHPDVLAGPEIAARLLHRLPERPLPWEHAEQTAMVGPPLYATSRDIAPHLLLIDTPDFDTGEGGLLVNRARAEPLLRTAEVIVYVFTNAVYNNLANTSFMADIVGGIGGRPTILVYRISRVASDQEALENCRVVANRLYEQQQDDAFPPEVIGIYRTHESDRVAEGKAAPELIPLGDRTAGRALPDLLRSLDVAQIKRHVLASDLRTIQRAARADYEHALQTTAQLALYREALYHAMAQEALTALTAFPANEAIALTTRLFMETSPPMVRAMRQTSRIVGAPLRGMRAVGRKASEWLGLREATPAPVALETLVTHDLLLAANALRNRLLEDTLILRLSQREPLLKQAQAALQRDGEALGIVIEPLGRGLYNLHIPVPPLVRPHQEALLGRNWEVVTERLEEAATELVGLPVGIEQDLREAVLRFRREMGFRERMRETLFASLSALPPLLGVTYTLLTANPVAGAGLLIQLEGIVGLNDLWALVSIPASAGLGEQDRRQLEEMLKPVFQLWLSQRVASVVALFEQSIAQDITDTLHTTPREDDERFAQVARALAGLRDAS